MTMGEMIKYQRESLGMSQEELGASLDPKVNKAAIQKWEKGTVENIKRTHIQQLAKKFGISPCELMCWEVSTVTATPKQPTPIDELIQLFNGLNREGQAELLNYARYTASKFEYQNKKKEYKNA